MGNQSEQQLAKQNESSSKGFIIGALIGGAIGAVATVLLTPKSGKDVRQTVMEQANTIKDKTTDLKDVAMSKGSQLADAAMTKGTEWADVAKTKSTQLTDVAMTKGTQLADAAKEKSTMIGQVVSKQSNELLNKVKTLSPQDKENSPKVDPLNSDRDVKRKLEETKKAFDETEHRLNS